MKFNNSVISISYPNIENLGKMYYLNEELLDFSLFKKALFLPVPDEAPLDIPRILITSVVDGISKISISPITTTIEINYSHELNSSFEHCLENIKRYVETMFPLLNKLTDEKYNYLGFVTNIINDDLTEDSTNYISKKLLNKKNISQLYDINIRYTFVEDGKFINVMLYNARKFEAPLNANKAGMLGRDKQISNNDIGIVLDINDRYSFNTDSEYVSNLQKLSELTDIASNYINNKLDHIISGS